MLPTLMFYIFSSFLLLCALLVVTLRNTVHAVCCLILAFINGAGLFLLTGAEFLSMILVIVYVGAVAVLFLFVVMMLGLNMKEKRTSSRWALWGLSTYGLLLSIQIVFLMMRWEALPTGMESGVKNAQITQAVTNSHSLGDVLYTIHALPFQIAGLVLLVSMIGAITLTFRVRNGVQRQSIRVQLERKSRETVTLVQAPLRKGLKKDDC